jgi:5'(3')-deoxyribonucleotidase
LEILLDCDGVLADFVSGAAEVHGKSPEILSWDFWIEWGMEPEEFWAPLATRDFWLGLRPYRWAGELLAGLREIGEVTVCTAPMHLNTEVCIGAKLDWLESYFGIRPESVMVGRKKHLMAGKDRILIDDSDENVYQFWRMGGSAVVFPQPWNLAAGRNYQHVLNSVEHLARTQMIVGVV